MKEYEIKRPEFAGGVEGGTSDFHEGLVEAVREQFQGTMWQCCQGHMRRNFLGKALRHLQEDIEDHLEEIFEADDHVIQGSHRNVSLS